MFLHRFLYFQNSLYEYLAGRDFIYKNGILLHIIFHLPFFITKINKLQNFYFNKYLYTEYFLLAEEYFIM